MQPNSQRSELRSSAVAEGRVLAEKLARSHYENFSVGSFLLPSDVRRDLYNIYAFCRLADDFADEAVGGVNRSDKLYHWETLLVQCASSTGKSPVGSSRLQSEPTPAETALFAALGDTIRRRKLDLQPFKDLLTAFRGDLKKSRYATWEELFEYARFSADPVGRLVLGVSGVNDPALFALSDKICTGLQLANHWQDVGDDYLRGRIYVPLEVMDQFSVTEASIADRKADDKFRAMMASLILRTRKLFCEGKPLLNLAPPVLRPQLELYWGGGMAAMTAIEANRFDVLNRKSRVRQIDRWRLAFTALGSWISVRTYAK